MCENGAKRCHTHEIIRNLGGGPGPSFERGSKVKQDWRFWNQNSKIKFRNFAIEWNGIFKKFCELKNFAFERTKSFPLKFRNFLGISEFCYRIFALNFRLLNSINN